MSCTSFARRRRILRKNANRKGAITLKHHEAEQHECAKCSLEQPLEGSRSASNQRLIPIGLSLSLLVVGMLMPPLPLWSVLVLSISYIIVGWPIIRHAGRNILRGQVFDEYGLMTIATFGAIALGEFPEAVAVMVFFSIGEYFQERAVDNSRRSIKALLSLRPDYANLKNGEVVTAVAPESVSVGQVIVVRPGERVPLDGIVREGESLLDTSPLTGESIPRVVTVGHEILAGTINQAGLLEVEVTKIYANSTVAKILELVEQASERKASTERFITSFARYYTPAVVVGAALLALLPPLLIPGQTFAVWVYRALVMLVISCPCALVVSVPLSYFGGIGAASRQGILFKGANYLDALSKLHTVVFDKTGTLTRGVFAVAEVVPQAGHSSEEVLSLAATLERHSTHPVAKAICQASTADAKAALTAISELAGLGMTARLGEKLLLVGNDRLMANYSVRLQAGQAQGGTSVFVALDGHLVGEIRVADELKPDGVKAVSDLRELGVRHISMLTGDYKQPAMQVAKQLGLDSYQAELLPHQKVSAVEAMQQALWKGKQKLVFVGDGINDAPVIARADIGVAMGGLGSDAAIEAADVVIMQDAPSKVATAIRLSRYTTAIVRQNVALSLGVKLAFMLLGALGLTTIWGAVFADVGVTLLAIANAMRALRFEG